MELIAYTLYCCSINFYEETVIVMLSYGLHFAKSHNRFSIPTVLDLPVVFDTVEHCLTSSLFTWLYICSNHWQELIAWFPPTSRKDGKR